MLLSTPGTCLAVKVKLNFNVWKVIRQIRFMMRGLFELLAERIETVAWLSQWKQILLLAQRGAQIIQCHVR